MIDTLAELLSDSSYARTRHPDKTYPSNLYQVTDRSDLIATPSSSYVTSVGRIPSSRVRSRKSFDHRRNQLTVSSILETSFHGGGGGGGATLGQESVMGPSAGSDLRLGRNRICERLHGVSFYREGDRCIRISPPPLRLTIVLRSLCYHVGEDFVNCRNDAISLRTLLYAFERSRKHQIHSCRKEDINWTNN
jgi:hypothetical protein